MPTFYRTKKFAFAGFRTQSLAWLIITLLIAIAGLIGCRADTSNIIGPETAPAESQTKQGEDAHRQSPRSTSTDEAGESTSAVTFAGLTFEPLDGAGLSKSDDKLTVLGTGHERYGVSIPVAHMDSTHVLLEPVRISQEGRFEATLQGRVEGQSKKLGTISHEPQNDGTTLIAVHFDEVRELVGGDVTVSFLHEGQVRYRTRLPVQSRLPVASYASTDETPNALEAPTSYYWAYIDGTWVLMVDWEEQSAASRAAGPVTLEPAFDTPFEEIPVDYLRLEFSIQGVSVFAESLELTAINMPSFVFTGVQQ